MKRRRESQRMPTCTPPRRHSVGHLVERTARRDPQLAQLPLQLIAQLLAQLPVVLGDQRASVEREVGRASAWIAAHRLSVITSSPESVARS
jgi:hypothetical protein